jgi:hypothetical protein
MSFDIAIGQCIEIEGNFAVAKLDGAMLRKLHPSHVFVGQPNVQLRVPLSICSTQRPPRSGQELFLDHAKVLAGAETLLRLREQDDGIAVDIRLIASGLEPMPRPAPEQKARFIGNRR